MWWGCSWLCKCFSYFLHSMVMQKDHPNPTLNPPRQILLRLWESLRNWLTRNWDWSSSTCWQTPQGSDPGFFFIFFFFFLFWSQLLLMDSVLIVTLSSTVGETSILCVVSVLLFEIWAFSLVDRKQLAVWVLICVSWFWYGNSDLLTWHAKCWWYSQALKCSISEIDVVWLQRGRLSSIPRSRCDSFVRCLTCWNMNNHPEYIRWKLKTAWYVSFFVISIFIFLLS